MIGFSIGLTFGIGAGLYFGFIAGVLVMAHKIIGKD